MPITYASNASRSESRNMVLEMLRKKKQENSAFTVADIGGSANSWADEVVDIYIDIVDGKGAKPTVVGDINRPEVWAELKRRYGKIDFILCTHTLEDIRDPVYVIERLQDVAKAGYISTPNKFAEMSHVDSHFFLGWSHHRWLFSLVKSGNDWVLYFIPKYASSNFFWAYSNHPWVVIKRAFRLTNKDKTRPGRGLPSVYEHRKIANLKNELGFIWQDSFKFEYKDYFPSTDAILNDLRKFTEVGL